MKPKLKSTKPAYKFNPFQRAWIEALIASRYKKTKGRLSRQLQNGKIACCCLGVACEIAPKFGVKLVKKSSDFLGEGFSYDNETLILPEKVRKALKLVGREGDLLDKEDKGNKLTSMHDDYDMSHREIGQFILKHPEQVFKK